jgi:hypothetical protein
MNSGEKPTFHANSRGKGESSAFKNSAFKYRYWVRVAQSQLLANIWGIP